jgi:hypothetical protein
MSRSHKKTAGFTDNSCSKQNKRIANRTVRRRSKKFWDLPMDGNVYRKMYESWNICDFRFLAHTKQEVEHMKSFYEGKEYRLYMK